MNHKIQRINSLFEILNPSKYEEDKKCKQCYVYKTVCTYHNKNSSEKLNKENNFASKKILTVNSSIANYATNNPKEFKNPLKNYNYKKIISPNKNLKLPTEIKYTN